VSRSTPALFDVFPKLVDRVPWAPLGDWPTPVDRLAALESRAGGPLFVKRDDRSGPRYGGNKVRTLEALFGQARAAGATTIWATGAFGSNHALATVLHAPAAGLAPGVILFPQPRTQAAHENLVATLGTRPHIRALWSWAALPFAMRAVRGERMSINGQLPMIMPPGGATPVGALGYVSAALEVAAQVAAGVMPAPARVVLGVGSTCTTAGLLAGFLIAGRLGLLAPPTIVPVRVTPWPVTAAFRIVSLAARTARLMTLLTGDARLAIPKGELAAHLRVKGGHIGRGYGYVTVDGRAAIDLFASAGGPALDTGYSGKAAAGLFALGAIEPARGATLFWATKSSLPMPPTDPAALAAAPARMRRWLALPLIQ
jgi:D-cysteine desulfhydrase